MKYAYILIALLTIFCTSCEKKDGLATPPEFDPGPHVFSGEIKDTIFVSKNDKNWWFEDISINGINGFLLEKDGKLKYYRKNPNPKADNNLADTYKYENDWFILEKLDERNIKLILKENKESEKRTFTFTCSVGNAIRKVTIIQNSKK